MKINAPLLLHDTVGLVYQCSFQLHNIPVTASVLSIDCNMLTVLRVPKCPFPLDQWIQFVQKFKSGSYRGLWLGFVFHQFHQNDTWGVWWLNKPGEPKLKVFFFCILALLEHDQVCTCWEEYLFCIEDWYIINKQKTKIGAQTALILMPFIICLKSKLFFLLA